jgi:hypothetical protein
MMKADLTEIEVWPALGCEVAGALEIRPQGEDGRADAIDGAEIAVTLERPCAFRGSYLVNEVTIDESSVARLHVWVRWDQGGGESQA